MLKSGKICKNNDHTCLFHCINTCQVPWTMFEHLAWRPRVQTAPGTRQMLMHEKKCVIPIVTHTDTKLISNPLHSTCSTQADRNSSQHDWKIVEWDIKHQNKQRHKQREREVGQAKSFVWIYWCYCHHLVYMGLDGTKPVCGVSYNVRLEPACSAKETS